MHKGLRAVTLVIALFSLALFVAACGDDDSGSSSSSSSSGSSSSGSGEPAPKGPSGAPIKLGFICSCTGAQASQLGHQDDAAQVWVNSVNDAGGINGAPVELTIKDDGGDPAKALQAVKELVEQDKVVALVGQFSLADAAFADYVSQKGIPVVGGISPDTPYLTNPDFFPSGSQLLVQTAGTLALAQEAGKKRIGVMYCAESPICAQLEPLATGLGQLYGLEASFAKVSATQPNYTAQCLQFKNDGVDALFPGVASPVALKIVADCAKQNYKPQVVSQTSTLANTWFDDPNMEGALLSGFNANPFDTESPSMQEFRDAYEKYFPGDLEGKDFSYDAIGVWAGGKLFEAAAKAGKIDASSTAEDVKKGLYALKDETLGGLSGPLNFTPDKPAFVPCYFGQKIEGGALASENNNEPICLSEEQATAVGKIAASLG